MSICLTVCIRNFNNIFKSCIIKKGINDYYIYGIKDIYNGYPNMSILNIYSYIFNIKQEDIIADIIKYYKKNDSLFYNLLNFGSNSILFNYKKKLQRKANIKNDSFDFVVRNISDLYILDIF